MIMVGVAIAAAGCGAGSEGRAVDLPPWKMVKDASGVEVRAVVKPPYTYLYALDGGLRQINFDSNADGKTDIVAFFSGGSIPDRLHIDANFDGRIDRWEEYGSGGVLLRYATSDKGGTPDRFVELDPKTGVATQQEVDADHDGRKERTEVFTGGRLSRVDLDTDADGKLDRSQDWRDGFLVSETIDRDGDGKPDIRIVHARDGSILRVERLIR